MVADHHLSPLETRTRLSYKNQMKSLHLSLFSRPNSHAYFFFPSMWNLSVCMAKGRQAAKQPNHKHLLLRRKFFWAWCDKHKALFVRCVLETYRTNAYQMKAICCYIQNKTSLVYNFFSFFFYILYLLHEIRIDSKKICFKQGID